MSSARRTLLTATAAGTLLGALWFVPSAHATVEHPARAQAPAVRTAQVTQQGRAVSTGMDAAGPGTAEQAADTTASGVDGTELADTGSVDTTPYVVGGTLFLTVGAGFVVYSVRRERLGF
ncbi:hypothetical protein [Streptomyces tropicalis]|uniref:Cell wall protein n=1 Tax=Streptomyces tropicalis TaxID=3034234 RepID=A0ABT6A0P0_9ACTN|nr:hypothetical protein [Streptomyces tropicalis]MDF3298208.1 hypothetical protein [Streptomyces tropicalis]